MAIPNYRVNLSFDADRKVFVARAPELEHCMAEGATRGEAIDRVEKEIEAQLQNMQERGQRGAPAAIDDNTFNGEMALKVTRTLHRDLAWQARQEGVELNHLVGELLAAGLDGRRQHRRSGNRPQESGNEGNQRGPGDYNERPRQGAGARYHGIMDDRANFIEYVRGLDNDAQAPGRPGGGRGPNRPGPSGPGNGAGGFDRNRGRGRGGSRPQADKRGPGPGAGPVTAAGQPASGGGDKKE